MEVDLGMMSTPDDILSLAIDDPKDNFYLRFCYVCHEEAPREKDHYNNYGGIVCLSCRAFFRRTHQNKTLPNFQCKFGSNCVLTPTNRRKCQKCRYQKCVKTGMKPEAVLTEDQKQIRFRKLLSKQKTDQIVFPRKGEKRANEFKKIRKNHKKENFHNLEVEEDFAEHPNEPLASALEYHSHIPEKFYRKVEGLANAYKRAILQIQSSKSSQVTYIKFFEALCQNVMNSHLCVTFKETYTNV